MCRQFAHCCVLSRFGLGWFYLHLSGLLSCHRGWETKIVWHLPKLGSLFYSPYKIPLAQPVFHSPSQIFTCIGERASASFPACDCLNISEATLKNVVVVPVGVNMDHEYTANDYTATTNTHNNIILPFCEVYCIVLDWYKTAQLYNSSVRPICMSGGQCCILLLIIHHP